MAPDKTKQEKAAMTLIPAMSRIASWVCRRARRRPCHWQKDLFTKEDIRPLLAVQRPSIKEKILLVLYSQLEVSYPA